MPETSWSSVAKTFITSFEWWQILIFLIVFVIVGTAYLIFKLKIDLTDITGKQRNLLEDRIKTLEDTVRNLTTQMEAILVNIPKAFIYKNNANKENEILNKMTSLEIEQQIEIDIISALSIYETWFNKNIITPTENIQCNDCKANSFYSLKNILKINIKEFFRDAIEKNGFIEKDTNGLAVYWVDKKPSLNQLIRDVSIMHFIASNDLKDYKLGGTKEKILNECLDEIHTKFFETMKYLHGKENSLIKKTEYTNTEYKNNVKGLFPSLRNDDIV